MSIEYFKTQFTNDKSRLQLNNAGLSIISAPARDKVVYWGNRFFNDGFYSDLDYMEDILIARKNLGLLIGCQHSEISFYQSTAYAISQLCFEFPFVAGDEVVMWDQEYSSNLYPWQEACKRASAKLVLVTSEQYQTPSEKIINSLTEKTRVVAISWLQFQTGAISDLEKIGLACKARNIFFFVDIIQGLGIHSFNMKKLNIDACAAGSHKWLVSPIGVGFLALDEKHTNKIRPHSVGSSTFGTCDDLASLECAPKMDSLKYEAGSKQVLEITALGASVDLILKTGVDNIEKEILRLSNKLANGLIDLGYTVIHNQTSIVNFVPKSNTEELLKKLPCLFAKRGPGFRLSPHAHNSDEDIDRVLRALK